MVQAIERYLKQAIVDRNHAVASAALVSSYVSHRLLTLVQLASPSLLPCVAPVYQW